jgi:hypothetical protein
MPALVTQGPLPAMLSAPCAGQVNRPDPLPPNHNNSSTTEDPSGQH